MRIFSSILLGLLVLSPLLPAQDDKESLPPAAPLTSDQLAKLLKELDAVEAEVNGKRMAMRSSAVEAFRKAAASDKAAYEFYLACVKELRFDSREARASEFREWRDRNEDRLKDDTQTAVLRLQLQYLVLTLRKAEGVEMGTIVPELETFVAGIAANAESLAGSMRDLRESVLRTPFAQVYELNKSLKLSDWSEAPGNFEEVYGATVLPYYRKYLPEKLGEAWDRRIDAQSRLVATLQAEDPVALETYQTEELPRLKWAKAKDIYEHVSQPHGSIAMLNLLKENPGHPNASKWLEEFKVLLGKTANDPVSTGA